MAINLVELIMYPLQGPIIDQLGGLIGESPEKTKTAVASIVPALLSGLVGTASKPGGGSLVSSILAQVDDGLLDNLGSRLGGQEAVSVSQVGDNLASTLFGDQRWATLVPGISKWAGLETGSTKSLLGLLAPIAFGVIKRQVAGQGLDTGGLVNLLLGQKENIAKALPSGLSEVLQSTGLLGGIVEQVQETIGTGRRAASPAIKESISPLRWLVPALILVALGLFLTKYFAEQ